MRRILIYLAGTLLIALGALASPLRVDAHHTTVSCQSPGIWLIVNSEDDKSMTFTTDQGHSGSIGADAWTTVSFSGTSLTVYGVWSNGVTNTSSGQGECTDNTTTTEATTSTSTSISTTGPTTTTSTTLPSTTSSSPTTTEPSTSSSDATTSTTSPQFSTTTATPTTTALSTQPSAPSSTTPLLPATR